MEKSSPKNSLTHLKKSLRIEEQKNKSWEKKYESVRLEIEDLRKKNMDQFELSQKYENSFLKLSHLEEENIELKNSLILERERNNELELQLKKVNKQFDEFKRINLVQEDCIENAETEIQRLREGLKISEERFSSITENIEISQAINLQEIIRDLKSKLMSANRESAKSCLRCEKKSRIIDNTEQDQNICLNIKRTNLVANRYRVSTDFQLKVIESEMNCEMKDFSISTITELIQSLENIELIPENLTKKFNDCYGKYWNCFMAEKFTKMSANYITGSYMKFEINKFYFILFQTNFQTINEISFTESLSNTRNNQTIKVLKKSVNIESHIEKFILNLTRDAINRNFDDYYGLSSFIRDTICAKYSTQWFVSVGESKYYCTSWAMSRSRKFLLFEIANLKLTIGEVGGWLW